MNILKEIQNEYEKNILRTQLATLKNVCICDKCNILIEFNDGDIDRTKTLPHIKCDCGELIQLHSKYYKSK